MIRDEFGNKLWMERGQVYLFLVRLNHRRRLGHIKNETWHVKRWPKEMAKAKGHWHNIRCCWLINREVVRRHKRLKFEWIHFVGFNETDTRYEIIRHVDDCVNQWEACYNRQGFERQLEFPLKFRTQYELDFWRPEGPCSTTTFPSSSMPDTSESIAGSTNTENKSESATYGLFPDAFHQPRKGG